MKCKICDREILSPPVQVREMMFGFRTVHVYFECQACEVLQIGEVPASLAQYYPDGYYSFNGQTDVNIGSDYLRRIKSSYLIHGRNRIAGRLLSIGYKMPEYFNWLRTAGIKFDDAILDVGSGSGDILVRYRKAGFTNLTGIDPFLKNEFRSADGKLKLLRRSIFEEQDPRTFDFIMLNHSFEHMDNPRGVFARLAALVNPGKMLLIRTPVNRSFASEQYGTDWVDWDAPRHLVVHSIKSLRLLASENKFQLENIVFDSTAFQFWGSEQYKRDIPLHSSESYAKNKNSRLFSASQMDAWKSQAAELNETGRGDQACFYMRRMQN